MLGFGFFRAWRFGHFVRRIVAGGSRRGLRLGSTLVSVSDFTLRALLSGNRAEQRGGWELNTKWARAGDR